MYRFPTNNPSLLQKWENIVRDINDTPDWKATRFTYICSNHFPQQEYIIPPSQNGPCRLKNTALPSIFTTQCTNNYGISTSLRTKLESPCHLSPLTTLSPADIVSHDHNYCKCSDTIYDSFDQHPERPALQEKLKRKVKSLQQQLRRTKAKQLTMADIIHELEQKLIVSPQDAQNMHADFDCMQLSIFTDTKNNINCAPTGRRYSDIVKEFAVTLNYYSPKAYDYVRSILPLPHPSLIRKWSSNLKCEPGFIQESFDFIGNDAKSCKEKRDCYLIIDAMSTRKQVFWDAHQGKYVGFVNYGETPPENPDALASEAVVFLLVGARSHWKCPIGYFLANKMSAKMQAHLVKAALKMSAEAGLRVWSVTTDGTAVNMSMFQELGCQFTTSLETMVTKFQHPTENYFVYAILDPCHMLKLARNALGHLGSFLDKDKKVIRWRFFSSLNKIQESEGFQLANSFTSKHLMFYKHKMNVKLAAQTISSSVANAIEFLDSSMKLDQFQGSEGTVKFIRTIDRLFDMLNSRNPLAKGFKQSLRKESTETWKEVFTTTAKYLLKLTTNDSQLLSTHGRKTFIIGFVTTILSTIEMADEMFNMENPFRYILTYKFSQDHIELLFSCIRAKGGWNNNPNCQQFKYAIRKMLLRNAVSASKNANCQVFSNDSTTIIPVFHSRKHKAPLNAPIPADDSQQESDCAQQESDDLQQEENMLEENFFCTQLNTPTTSEFLSNILFYISGFVVSKLVKKISCLSCKNCLLSQFNPPTPDHDYCSVKFSEVASASAFTLFVNKGGLRIPSESVYLVVEYTEKEFKASVCKDGKQITRESKLKEKLVMNVCRHFLLDSRKIFQDHEQGLNENLFEEDHQSTLVKLIAERYITLRLFTYGKRYNESVVKKGQPGDRHKLTKLILFKNE